MELKGSKVSLRAIELNDKEILKDLMNDSENEYFLGGASFPVSNYQQEEWIKSQKLDKNLLRCMIEDKESKFAVGTVILSDIDYINGHGEIHIKIKKEYQGKGYGYESICLVMNYGFNELRLNCIYALINDFNLSSLGLFEKIGFKKEGILRSRVYKRGNYHNQIIYSILREEI